MGEGRVIRLSWNEWKSGRAAKRAALAAHGLSGESRRKNARPEARRQLDAFRARAEFLGTGPAKPAISALSASLREKIRVDTPHGRRGDTPLTLR